MFKIGDFSRLAQVSVRMLRHYDKLGLLEPSYTDRFTGYRYYTIDQLPRLNRIVALNDLGLTLAQISDLLGQGRQAARGAAARHAGAAPCGAGTRARGKALAAGQRRGAAAADRDGERSGTL